MVLAIIATGLELLILAITNVMPGGISYEFAIFMIVLFVLCTIVSIVCIPYNALKLNISFAKAPSVVGLIFAIHGTAIGMIFLITLAASLY